MTETKSTEARLEIVEMQLSQFSVRLSALETKQALPPPEEAFSPSPLSCPTPDSASHSR